MAWEQAATSAIAFELSADAFMRWAPVTDEFKALDEEIMRNSLHLRWIGIRRDVKETLNSQDVLLDMQNTDRFSDTVTSPVGGAG